MALTNAQLLRELAGDPGQLVRELLSGDGSATAFYLKAPPLRGDDVTVTVGGTLRTEVATTPGATEYTVDDETGLLTFGAAPASGTNNVVVSYYTVDLPDSVVVESLRQLGLTSTDTSDTGPALGMLQAAALACDIMSARHVNDYDISVDGQSLSRGQMAENWRKRAETIRETYRRTDGLHSMPIIRVDGYNRDDVSTQDIDGSASNPRRRYYGEQDRIP